jgi:hypothetical protein
VSSFTPQTANHAHAVLIGGPDTFVHLREYGTDSTRPAKDGTRPYQGIEEKGGGSDDQRIAGVVLEVRNPSQTRRCGSVIPKEASADERPFRVPALGNQFGAARAQSTVSRGSLVARVPRSTHAANPAENF